MSDTYTCFVCEEKDRTIADLQEKLDYGYGVFSDKIYGEVLDSLQFIQTTLRDDPDYTNEAMDELDGLIKKLSP